MAKMPRLDVTRYEKPDDVGWLGYIEPENQKWIVYLSKSGSVYAYNRNPKTGAVIGEPAILTP